MSLQDSAIANRVAKDWVVGRELDLLGRRVAEVVSNALGSEYLDRRGWIDDPEAWAEELQMYAADTLEAIPLNVLTALVTEYASDLLE